MSVHPMGMTVYPMLPMEYLFLAPVDVSEKEVVHDTPLFFVREQVSIAPFLEEQIRLFNIFCKKFSFVSAWESLFCIEFTELNASNIRSFCKEVEVLSAYLRKNPNVAIPTIYKVICEGRDRSQLLQKIYIYKMLLETMVSLSEKGEVKCEIDPRVREAFVFVIGYSDAITKKKTAIFDEIYQRALRILDPKGKLLIEIAKDQYMPVEDLLSTVNEVHKVATERGLERRISINSIAPVRNLQQLLFHSSFNSDIVLTGSFNFKEMIDTKIDRLKRELYEISSREEIILKINQCKEMAVHEIKKFMNSCGSVFSSESLITADRHASFYKTDTSIQKVIVIADQIWRMHYLPCLDNDYALACFRENPDRFLFPQHLYRGNLQIYHGKGGIQAICHENYSGTVWDTRSIDNMEGVNITILQEAMGQSMDAWGAKV